MSWNWQQVTVGHFRLDGGSMFGVVPRAIWQRLVAADEQNRIPLACHCLLLEREGKRVLVECGYGTKWTDKEREIFALEDRAVGAALRELAVEPESISAVLLSHLHFDHAAGVSQRDSSGNTVSIFPAAGIYVQQREWDDALAGRSTMNRTYLASTLEPITRQVELVDGDSTILGDIRLRRRPGHTWGLQTIEFDAAEGTVCFVSDVMPTRNHVHPAYSMGYDMLPWDNMQSKLALLEQACEGNWRLALYHEVDHPLVRVVRSEGGDFELQPVP
jgi:glyoxylase-like metal-dependent hydrolase (beta-lactamase superfamily II)